MRTEIDINLDKPCQRCGQFGATPSGLCLDCAGQMITTSKLDILPDEERDDEDGDWVKASPTLLALAIDIIRKYHPALAQARIGFVFKKQAPKKDGKYTVGKASKVSPRLRVFSGLDFLIWVAEDVWEACDEHRRRAIVDHELCHCNYSLKEPRMVHHDIEEFNCILERYGLWNQDLFRAKDALEKAVQLNLGLAFEAPAREGGVVAVEPELVREAR